MSHRLLKTLALAVTTLGVASGFALAAGPTHGTTRTNDRRPVSTAGKTITGEVEQVEAATGWLRLRSADGETVELAAPPALLAGLQAGDSVEVAIRKTTEAQPAAPDSESPRRPPRNEPVPGPATGRLR